MSKRYTSFQQALSSHPPNSHATLSTRVTVCARMLCMGSVPWTGARDQYMMVAGAVGTSLPVGRRGVMRIFCSRPLRELLPSRPEGEDGRRLTTCVESEVAAFDTWRSEDGLRDAEMRGVPGVVGVVACEVDGASGTALGGGLGGMLKVDVEAVAWCVGWRYGDRWGLVIAGNDSVRASSFTDRLLSVSPSSPVSIASNKLGIALAMLPW